MAQVSTLRKIAHRQLAVFEALRRLGFQAQDITVRVELNGDVFSDLRQGPHVFPVEVSIGEKVDPAMYIKVWTEESAHYDCCLSAGKRAKIYDRWFSVDKLLSLTDRLKQKRFFIPRLQERVN